jgi:predicted P-loop ATPase
MIEPTKVTTPSGVVYSKDKNTDSTLKTEVPDGGIPPILGTYTIPIEKLLANSNKKRGRGVAEGGRDNAAIAYARDILGVQHKEFLLVPFNGGYYRLDITQNAAGLFETFCDGCNPPLGDSDRVRIWKSANSKESTPSIRSEGTLIDLGILHLKQILGGDKPSSDGGRHNILTLDNSIRSMGETVRLNQMTGKVEVGNEPLDLNQLRRFTMNKFGYTLSTEDCQQCWVGIAQENSYHPVEVYLASLPTNTPTLDLSTLASKLLGNDSKGASAMLKRKLIAAVARVMEPGCKDDSLLVLMGAQGCGKTSFIETLASTEWFSNDLSDITNKDHLRLLTENWLIELGEVDDVMNRKTNEAMKHFLSHKKDTYRPAYGRENITAPRSSSLFASTNKTELLNDSTGTRRFWVVEVKQRIDLTQVCAMRDSIWYSALQSYKNGEQWYLTDEEDKEREEEAKQFTEVDPWVESLYLPKLVQRKGVGYTTSYSALYDHLGIPMAARTKVTDRRLHSILTGLGFIRKAVKVEGKSVTCWYTAIKTW